MHGLVIVWCVVCVGGYAVGVGSATVACEGVQGETVGAMEVGVWEGGVSIRSELVEVEGVMMHELVIAWCVVCVWGMQWAWGVRRWPVGACSGKQLVWWWVRQCGVAYDGGVYRRMWMLL